jgi:multisubunit Na+/H+ antiporter MnhB subunit
MHIGYIVGAIVAVSFIICGVAATVLVKKKQKKNKWPIWTIIFGIVALISAVINYNLFSN